MYGLRYDRETGRITGMYRAATPEELSWQIPEDVRTAVLVTPECPDPLHAYIVQHGALAQKTRVMLQLSEVLTVGECVMLRAVPEQDGPPLRSDSFHTSGRVARMEPAGSCAWQSVLLSQGVLRMWVDDAHYYSDPITVMVR